ncbi:hypothetical protein ND861_04225 [Leptospira sp. 2 VSF19]|uniref:Uncharacterized protein n=1 Tax=Leptospira soteropolitanensis TaxID=2950025 RepID=A0AAW5VE97_9LEPT|nr:hypothetical protein [Leptospira soteropolitanensis]MCW7491855.1 hypothetical protein [Leptospira soteropolitanensis]MCW7499439.1 hypothetical protein [Leptospira soteropolitanensis]MCW7520970.1 hypothetical protein [Leptospira soteropolitanensis]MCW7525543.1 hypothetical protein [Leptospira soteropolitanensis]MCW7529409.1 hypothetical protein [Leptospira soteropolitanensis]
MPVNKKKTITFLFILILLSLFLSGLVYILFLKKTKEDPKQSSYDSRSEVYWQRLQNRPEVLIGPGYPQDLRDFLETLRGKESYLWKGDRDKTYEYLLETYPDERAHVLYALYVAFMNWKEKSLELEQREDLSSYEKLTAVNRMSEQIFPLMIRNLIFPKHPTTPPVFLLSYLEDYVQKNPYSYSRERKRIFLKKKKELYQNEKWEIQSWESPTFLRQVIELIYSREILEMSEEEKTSYRNAKLEELKADFWN